MLIGGIVAVVVVISVAAAVLLRRRTHDDVHSVEGYHRQLHTLEEIRTHPSAASRENGDVEVPYPASAFRVSGSSTVRLTEPGQAAVPPVPPPPVPNPAEPVTFDDAGPDPVPASFMTGSEDRVMHSINHRPRRLGGPVAAIAAVTVLIVVLIVTGLHTSSPTRHPKTPAPTTVGSRPRHASHPATTTTTIAPLTVSAPTASSAHAATYHVADASYSLSLAATSAECWVEVTDTASGSVLFTATLFSGQSHTIAATGPLTVIAGAPAAFSATVNGASVTLPIGYQAPFTLSFETAQAA